MENITQLTKSGQSTVPATFREVLGLSAGDHLRWTIDGGRLIAEPVIFSPKVPHDEALQIGDAYVERHADVFERLKDL